MWQNTTTSVSNISSDTMIVIWIVVVTSVMVLQNCIILVIITKIPLWARQLYHVSHAAPALALLAAAARPADPVYVPRAAELVQNFLWLAFKVSKGQKRTCCLRYTQLNLLSWLL